MAMGSVLLALAMVAADGPPCPPVETTNFQVRVLSLDGLDWRTSSYTRLQPVARQGTSTIWTADRALAASLADRAKGLIPCHAITAVGEAVMTKAEKVNYIAAMDRVADGPMNQSSAIAFVPRPEQVEERFSIRVEGRKLDQGILTRIALEETHVDVIHGVPQTETLVPVAARSPRCPGEVDSQVKNVATSTSPASTTKTSITSSVQIPEVTHACVSGEWLIPHDGVLLVSLGIKTAADENGMAVVRERVAVIEACPSNATGSDGVLRTTSAGPDAPFQHVKLSQPVVPSRSMPEAIDPIGNIVDLPPLPEALASADLDRIKPEANQPSPQAQIRSAPSSDPALARTSFDVEPAAAKAPKSISIVLAEDQARSILPRKLLDSLSKEEVGIEFDFNIKDGSITKKPGGASCIAIELPAGDTDVAKALKKAGIELDLPIQIDADHVLIFPKDLASLMAGTGKSVVEKCPEDSTTCPVIAKSMKVAPPAGGIKLVPEPSSPVASSNLRALTDQLLDFARFLDSAEDKAEARKLLGQVRTTVVPIGHEISIELKATVISTATDQANSTASKGEASKTRR